MPPIPRVKITPEATAVVEQLRARNGDLMFHQSGGCCDGSAPMCYPADEFVTSDADVLLGELDLGADADGLVRVIPFWMSTEQFRYWRHTYLVVDVVAGRGGGFSLEAPLGVRFLIRSRLVEG